MSAPVDVLAVMGADCDFIAAMAVTMKRGGTKRVYLRAERYPGEKWTADKLATFARGQVDKWLVTRVEIESITPMNDAARAALARIGGAP